MNRKKIVYEINTEIKKAFPDASVILYGSEARGNSTVNSDIDLLILLNKDKVDFDTKTHLYNLLYDIELREQISISPLIYARGEWENRPIKTPFYLNVQQEGILL